MERLERVEMGNLKPKLPESTGTADKENRAELSLEDLEELLRLGDNSKPYPKENGSRDFKTKKLFLRR